MFLERVLENRTEEAFLASPVKVKLGNKMSWFVSSRPKHCDESSSLMASRSQRVGLKSSWISPAL